MTAKRIGLAAAIALCACLAACDYGLDELFARKAQVDKRSGHMAAIAAPSVPGGTYTALVMSDVHFGAAAHRPHIETDGTIDKVKAWWAGLAAADKPRMILFLGDQVESGKEDEYKQFKTFADDMASFMGGIPYYCIAGNHDLYNEGWEQYAAYCKPGVSAYYFSTGGFDWYFLDSASGTLGDSQLADFKKLAKRNPGVPKLAFTHYPIYAHGDDFYFSLSDPQERNKIIDILAANNFKYVLDAHQHDGAGHDFGTFQETNVSSLRDNRTWHLLTLNPVLGTAKIKRCS